MDTSALSHQPVLAGRLVRLEPAGPEHLGGLWPLYSGRSDIDEIEVPEVPDLADPIVALTREQIRLGLARARDRADRADWAVVRAQDGAVVGEVVLFELDEDSASMEFRIALVGPQVFGLGYGTEATRLVRDFAFGPLGLHRLTLEVNAFNEAAVAVYRKAGFVLEGVRREAVRHEGAWYDVLDMALLESDPRP